MQPVDEVRTDGELVVAARGGDRAAFGLLIDRHRARIQSLTRGLLRSREDAEDVTQEALLQAYLGLDRLRRPASFGSWVAGIALNLARMRLRERGRRTPPDVTGGERVPGETLELVSLLRDALATLTPAQRQVVVLHDLEDRTSTEIAALLGERPGAVRVRLHRARMRLRERLPELEPRRKETRPMVEVTLEDVVVRVAPGDAEPAQLANERLRIVILREQGGDRVLPIWVGAAEGDALALQLGGASMPRPLTADLMARLVEASGARVESVAVASLRDKTFYAIVTVAHDGRTTELDARPSDALNLAARVDAPIRVDAAVMDEAGTPAGTLEETLERDAEELGAPVPEGAWRSLTPELVKSLYPTPGKR